MDFQNTYDIILYKYIHTHIQGWNYVFTGSKVQCMFCFEISTQQERGRKCKFQNKACSSVYTQHHIMMPQGLWKPTTLTYRIEPVKAKVLPFQSVVGVFKAYFYALCQDVPLRQCSSLSHLTPYNKDNPLIWTEHLDQCPEVASLPLDTVPRERETGLSFFCLEFPREGTHTGSDKMAPRRECLHSAHWVFSSMRDHMAPRA